MRLSWRLCPWAGEHKRTRKKSTENYLDDLQLLFRSPLRNIIKTNKNRCSFMKNCRYQSSTIQVKPGDTAWNWMSRVALIKCHVLNENCNRRWELKSREWFTTGTSLIRNESFLSFVSIIFELWLKAGLNWATFSHNKAALPEQSFFCHSCERLWRKISRLSRHFMYQICVQTSPRKVFLLKHDADKRRIGWGAETGNLNGWKSDVRARMKGKAEGIKMRNWLQ